MHNSRQDFFDDFDIKKAETLTHAELIDYNMGLHPIDDYTDMYKSIATFEAQRFVDARTNDKLDEYLPVINEVMLDAEITVGQYTNPNCVLDRDYVVHLQGIIDRVFIQDGAYIPMEFKTGPWKDYKLTSMRKEMAFYKLLIENASQASLDAAGIDRDIPITHWGWYYPASNYIQVEPVKKQSTTAVYRGMTQIIKSYEEQSFIEKYYYKTCAHCSFFPICEKAQAESWI